MAKCRITNIKPPCDYAVEGIAQIWLLDWDDFDGLRFEGGLNYDICRVKDVLRRNAFVEIDAPYMVAKYSSTGTYTHVVETFISGLKGDNIANLHLATKKRFVVLFKTNAGTYHLFGYDSGATVSYASQTAEGIGSLLTITAGSIYPLFETTANVFKTSTVISMFSPDFINNTYCINE